MTAPDRDPLTIAREVVREYEDLARNGGLFRRERQKLDLARAVIAFAELENYCEAERDTSNTKDEAIAWDNAATLIHNALNGATND